MALGFTMALQNGVYHLKGCFDEIAEFDKLLTLPDTPLKLNLRGIDAINSLGLRRLIVFTKNFGEREMELHDCPPVFVEAVNVIPLAVGGQSKIQRIKSLYLPFHCKGDHEKEFTVPLSAIQVGDTVAVPTIDCPACRLPMTPDLDTDLDEFFFFLTA